MGVFKDSLLIAKLPSTYKSKDRQGIAVFQYQQYITSTTRFC